MVARRCPMENVKDLAKLALMTVVLGVIVVAHILFGIAGYVEMMNDECLPGLTGEECVLDGDPEDGAVCEEHDYSRDACYQPNDTTPFAYIWRRYVVSLFTFAKWSSWRGGARRQSAGSFILSALLFKPNLSLTKAPKCAIMDTVYSG